MAHFTAHDRQENPSHPPLHNRPRRQDRRKKPLISVRKARYRVASVFYRPRRTPYLVWNQR